MNNAKEFIVRGIGVLWIMFGLVSLPFVLFLGPMLFDSPTSTHDVGVIVMAIGLFGFPIACFISGKLCLKRVLGTEPSTVLYSKKLLLILPIFVAVFWYIGFSMVGWEETHKDLARKLWLIKNQKQSVEGRLQSGCVWRELTGTIISAKVESCKVGTYALEVMLDERGLERKITYDDGATAKTRIVELFKKRSGEAPEHVLERLFIDTLPTPYEREHCVVKERAPGFSAKGFADKSKRAFQITPDAIYFDKLEKEADGGIPEDSCNTNGEYGFYADGVYYFEFHEGSDNFVWVANAEEDPGFDPQSLIF